MGRVIKWVLGAILIVLIIQAVFVVVPYTISTFNEQKDIRNSYSQKVQEKEVIMNEFTSCLTSSLSISNSNAEYFKENIQIIMDNRQDGMGLMWKWVREINPNANYKEVADIFKNMQQMLGLSDFGIIIMKLTPREESFIKNGIMTIHHVVVNKFIIIWKKFYI